MAVPKDKRQGNMQKQGQKWAEIKGRPFDTMNFGKKLAQACNSNQIVGFEQSKPHIQSSLGCANFWRHWKLLIWKKHRKTEILHQNHAILTFFGRWTRVPHSKRPNPPKLFNLPCFKGFSTALKQSQAAKTVARVSTDVSLNDRLTIA